MVYKEPIGLSEDLWQKIRPQIDAHEISALNNYYIVLFVLMM